MYVLCVCVFTVTQRVLTGNFIEDPLCHVSKVPGGTPNFSIRGSISGFW